MLRINFEKGQLLNIFWIPEILFHSVAMLLAV